MKLLDDLKAFLNKGQTLTIAIGVALGFAIAYLIFIILNHLVDPLFSMITAGKGLPYLLDWQYLHLGSLIMGILHFAIAVGIIYFGFGVFWKCCGSEDRKDSTPTPPPPPPAPPV